MNDAQSFGAWLKEQRQALDLSRDDLADQVGCATVTIAMIERGQRRPSRQVAERIAAAIGIPLDERPGFVQRARGRLPGAPPATSALLAGAPAVAAAAPDQLGLLPTPPLDNLPTALTSFVGRDREVGQVGDLLAQADVRLLTLTGPPGIGKTRLSLAVAKARRHAFAHGVCFVPLAPLADPALVLPTVAQTLGLQEGTGQLIAQILSAYLRDKQLLLVLDNFEQVLAAAPAIAALLTQVPHLKLLVTSRAPLHVYGEHEFPVPPLELPAAVPSVTALQQVAAVSLWVQRAQAVRPDFTLTEANAAAVAAICQRLDGLPLAIELAAARSKLFSPPALLARLADAPLLELLAGGPRDHTDRQRTLRGAIAWSYDLLDAEEQRLFRRLAVFVGGGTLEAVEAVSNGAGDLRIAVGEGLLLLVEHSLLQAHAGVDGTPRFEMLVTIHGYAQERLVESGEADAIRRQHALYYLALAERAEPLLRGAEQQPWLDRLEREHDNLRAALGWALAQGEGELAQRLAGALWRFWAGRGYLTEGRAGMQRARTQAAARTLARPADCRAGGILAQAQTD
jgi:predicted ATPase/transcriptional regulator with XRE-family HTH domain